MDTDLVLTLGIVLCVLSIPSLISAWVEGRVSRLGAVMLIASIGMMVAAQMLRPSGYVFSEIPGIMLAVAVRLMP